MDERVTELHCIMPMSNIRSVLEHGILCYDSVAKLPVHQSVAMPEIQERRDLKRVPNGLALHQYANLYFHARNPMLYKRRNEDVCVLQVSTKVFELSGVVITDQNAASDYARFLAPWQHAMLDFEAIYARDWRHPEDQREEWKHKSKKCAETLVPSVVPTQFITGAYVSSENNSLRLRREGFLKPIYVDSDLFFH